jgi:hypothetical protein
MIRATYHLQAVEIRLPGLNQIPGISNDVLNLESISGYHGLSGHNGPDFLCLHLIKGYQKNE